MRPFSRAGSLFLRLPMLASILELGDAPRKFLLFMVFNVLSWQCLVGPMLVLFGRKIDMPASWIGFLISSMPISMLLVAVTAPLVNSFGPKRLMFIAWTLRNLIACSVFLMPWAISWWGARSAWYVLFGATFGFCLMRAVGVGGWFPWLHEVVPERQRGVYFSAEASVAHLISLTVIVGQGVLLQGDPGVNRFLMIYSVGILAGFLSLVYMSQVPGGHRIADFAHLRERGAAYHVVLADQPYLAFVLLVSLAFSSVSWLGSSLVMYMRDAVGLSSRTIMMLMSSGSVGILLTNRFWMRFAEHSGGARTMLKSLIGHSVFAFFCLFLLPDAWWTPYALCPVIFFINIFVAAFWMVAHRTMLSYIKDEGRVGYTNIWIFGTASAMGITPIAVGFAIDWLGLWGFRTCFIVSCALGFCCAIAALWVVHDGKPIENLLSRMMNPSLPLRTLGRIAWITMGLHESNRADKGETKGTCPE